MNGNLYKVRASLAGYVKDITTDNKSETLSKDDHDDDENHLVWANVTKIKCLVLDDLSGKTIHVDYNILLKESITLRRSENA